jgi:hypothetical protein
VTSSGGALMHLAITLELRAFIADEGSSGDRAFKACGSQQLETFASDDFPVYLSSDGYTGTGDTSGHNRAFRDQDFLTGNFSVSFAFDRCGSAKYEFAGNFRPFPDSRFVRLFIDYGHRIPFACTALLEGFSTERLATMTRNLS